MKRLILKAFVGLVGLGAVGICAAQQEVLQPVEVRAYSSCLTPSVTERGNPKYPEKALFSRRNARIEVQLTFAAADAAPTVRILTENKTNDDLHEEFVRSVERFVAAYRLPCIGKEPEDIRQVFQFDYDNQKVYATDDSSGASAYAAAQCRNEYVGDKAVYPFGSQRPFGNVLTRLRFTERDAAPEVKVIFGGGHFLLAEVGKAAAQGWRLRCEKPLGKPVEWTYLQKYTPEGGSKVTIKDMDFITFLKSVKRESWGKPVFDFNTMSCPFKVRIQLVQPHGANGVSEIESRDPNRLPFLRWLETLAFQYPDGFERFLVGESSTVTVPCMKLDLS